MIEIQAGNGSSASVEGGSMKTALQVLCIRSSVYIYIYICVYKKKNVIERTRDLIYLKFVATDFFPKIISPSAGENSGDLA